MQRIGTQEVMSFMKDTPLNPQTTDRGPMDPDTSLTSAQEVLIRTKITWGLGLD